MPRHDNQLNFDPDIKLQYFSSPTQKPSQFRSLHWNKIKSNPPHCNQVNFDNLHKKLVKFDPPTQNEIISTNPCNQVNFDPHSTLVNFVASTQNLSSFRSRN